ncbi:MAG: ankyrin repeat domain-containing protein [Rhodothermales bacterium]
MRYFVFLILSTIGAASAFAQANSLHQQFADALSSGNLDSLQLLINEGIDVNAHLVFFADSPHSVSLHPIRFAKTRDVATFLIQQGADVNAQDTLGNTALHDAVAMKRTEVAALLLENGANPNLKGSYGRTPLHVAVMEEHVTLVRLLRGYGADINAQTENGMTVLHLAVIDNNVELVKLALLEQIDPTLKDTYGNTALQWAEMINRPRDETLLRVIALLKEYEMRD